MIQPFKRLTVSHSLSEQGDPQVRVTWALNRGFVAPGPYSFRLERLYGPTDTPTVLAVGGDGHWMTDNNPRRPQLGGEYYYRVVLIDDEGTEWESQVAPSESYWGARDWRIARAIVRAENLVMRKRSGTYGWLVKRRYWGSPCPTCLDPITGQVDNPNCGTCYGTAFEEGYHQPIPCWVVVEQLQRQSVLAETGHEKKNLAGLRMLAYPPPEPGDIWVQAHTDRRYRIAGQLQPVAIHRGIPLVMQVSVEELPTSDAIYEIPVGDV